ncbi:MAG: hypothetical protein U0T81_01150 [Saprospiraceae bacterium]
MIGGEELVYSGENLLDGNKAKGIGWNGEFRSDKALPGVYALHMPKCNMRLTILG